MGNDLLDLFGFHKEQHLGLHHDYLMSEDTHKHLVSKGKEIKTFSDSCNPKPNSIMVYIKGPLPTHLQGENLVLIASVNIHSFPCILTKSPKSLYNRIVDCIALPKKTSNRRYPDSILGNNVVIEDDVEIGRGCIIGHNTVIHKGTSIGDFCKIGSNCVIGGDGYSFFYDDNMKFTQLKAIGGVTIGNNVSIGDCVAIDKGSIDDAIIEDNVKIDNLVHLGHDAKVQDSATITAGAIFSGYVSVGKNTRIAPNSCIMQRTAIGDNSLVGLGSVVTKDVKESTVVAGSPARELRKT